MIWIIIIMILLLFAVIVSNFRIAKVKEIPIDVLFGNMTLSIILGAFLLAFIQTKLGTPTALDVYRGKTELKITYIDTIPQDTVVVWKHIGGVK